MENVSSERKLFGEVVRNTHKYGSTTKPQPHHSKYVKHFISRVDTLQGIALKYGTTVEQIKRDNKLWTNDSLFLREHLFIPITNENNHLVTDDWLILSYEEVRPRSNSENVTCGATGTDVSSPTRDKSHSDKNSCVATESKAANSENNITGVDFFSKYDNSIAVIKSKVEKLEKESGYDENLSSLIPQRKNSDFTRATRTPPRRISVEDPDSPVLVIRSNTRSLKVQSAVNKAEEAIDSLFEL